MKNLKWNYFFWILVGLTISSQNAHANEQTSFSFCIKNVHTGKYLSDVITTLYPRCSKGEVWRLTPRGSNYCIQNIYTGKYLSDVVTELYPRCSKGEVWSLIPQGNHYCIKNIYTGNYLSNVVTELYPRCSTGEVWNVFDNEFDRRYHAKNLELAKDASKIYDFTLSMKGRVDQVMQLVPKGRESVAAKELNTHLEDIVRLIDHGYRMTQDAHRKIVELNKELANLSQLLRHHRYQNTINTLSSEFIDIAQGFAKIRGIAIDNVEALLENLEPDQDDIREILTSLDTITTITNAYKG